ncbi:MAG: alpha/beta hydrolase, partial [Lachnoanaerobaculum sp.]|nr:alpha/beta hydrolase [Lachnoanaerobaculum sp.]
MEFYRSNGERIHYEIIGKGFPIVFLHGNNLESGYFKKQRVLGRYYKLIFVDSLGHGKSGDILGKISFSYLADSLDELLSYLNIEKCLLVGHSDGANLAIKYAALYQERVAGILANSGNISFKGLKFLPGYACYLEEVLYKTL